MASPLTPTAELLAARPQRVRLHVYQHGAMLAQAVGGQRKQTPDRRGLLLTLGDEQGRLGLGEASPLAGFSPDTLSACQAALQSLSGERSLRDFDDEGWPLIPELAALPAARCAFETAYADLWAQRMGPTVRLATVLAGGQAPTTTQLPINALCGSQAAALQAVRAGAGTLKLKLAGEDWEAECARLIELRRALPADTQLRIDLNGSLTLAQARHRLPRLAELGLQYVEQPVAAGTGELAQLAIPGVPLAADESLLYDRERAALLSHAPCVAWVLKPMLLGLRQARRLALLAQAHGRAVVITHAFDGPVAHAAACELALSLLQPPWACGLAPHAGLAAWSATPLRQLSGWQSGRPSGAPGPSDYVLTAPPAAGLGFADRGQILSSLARPVADGLPRPEHAVKQAGRP